MIQTSDRHNSTTDELISQAIEYAEMFDTSVLPFARGARAPHKGLSRTQATKRPSEIERLFTQYPNSEISVRIPGDLVIADVDDDALVRQQRLWLPPTALDSTVRGHHHWLRARDAMRTVQRFRPGLDVLGKGQFVVVPPSRHRQWIIHPSEGIAPAPDWMDELVKPQPIERRSPTPPPDDRRTELGSALTDLLADERNLPAVLPLLNIRPDARPGRRGFLCPLGCGDRRPSAGLCRGANGVIVLHTFHGCQGERRMWPLPDVRAGVVTGTFRQLSRSECAVWALQLLRDAGVIRPLGPADLPLPPDTSPLVREVAQGFGEVLALARSMGLDSIPFGREFGALWTGLTPRQIAYAVNVLERVEIIEKKVQTATRARVHTYTRTGDGETEDGRRGRRRL